MTPPSRTSGITLPALSFALAAITGCGVESPAAPPPAAPGPALMLTYTSNQPPNPAASVTDLYLKVLSSSEPGFLIPNVNTTANEGPAGLSGDGRKLAFYTDRFYIGSLATIAIYDVGTGALHIPGPLKIVPNTQNPALSYDGRFLAYQAQGAGPFDQDIQMIDLAADTLVALNSINEYGAADFDPSLSGDGKLLAFASNGSRAVGSFDVLLYSVPGDSFVATPNLDTVFNELSPSLSRDGRYIAFQTGDPRLTKGLVDVEVYDRQTESLLDLPGANTELAEFQPVISPDGRYLAYSTESQGGRDIRIYDIQEKHLVTLTGVNSPTYFEELPSISEVPPVIYHPAGLTTTTSASAARAAAAGGMAPAPARGAAAFMGAKGAKH